MAVIPAFGVELTERELEILKGVSDGERQWEIAERLGISEETVKTHMRRIKGKLGALNSPHAVSLGYINGDLLVVNARE